MNTAHQRSSSVPEHIAIIMDGNGRWAKSRAMPRVMGHRRGVRLVRDVVSWCHEYGILYLSLFAFSTENWHRSETEVSSLMSLFLRSLKNEAKDLIDQGVRLRIIGNRQRLSKELISHIEIVETQTKHNDRLQLIICVDYGGRWDICQAIEKLIKHEWQDRDGVEVTEDKLSQYLQTADIPAPDLLIRTGGERRISNYYLWQLAYTELYFCDIYWPDFAKQHFEQALFEYQHRVRRFGRVP